mmetsp:Transcript_3047/g.10882  ORF Transcript_3047/g.10882 Transcript_3047/m.10882 type:complete len:212 (+) Transcript_3047:3011-3646(+)
MLSNGSLANAACTVAFGNHDNATNALSFKFKSPPPTARYATGKRTHKPMNKSNTDFGIVDAVKSANFTALPMTPNSNGWNNVLQARDKSTSTECANSGLGPNENRSRLNGLIGIGKANVGIGHLPVVHALFAVIPIANDAIAPPPLKSYFRPRNIIAIPSSNVNNDRFHGLFHIAVAPKMTYPANDPIIIPNATSVGPCIIVHPKLLWSFD